MKTAGSRWLFLIIFQKNEKLKMSFKKPEDPVPVDYYLDGRPFSKPMLRNLETISNCLTSLEEYMEWNNSQHKGEVPNGMTPLGAGYELDTLALLSAVMSDEQIRANCGYVLRIFHLTHLMTLPELLQMAGEFQSVEERAFALLRIRDLQKRRNSEISCEELVRRSLQLDYCEAAD